MATNRSSNNKRTNKEGSADETPADRCFSEYEATHQDRVNIRIHYFCIPLLAFSSFGLIWAIPFPHLGFLGLYNGYFNWASFIIAIAIYYYLKLSPVISYLILFILLGFSYGIMQLLTWQAAGGPLMWALCVSVFIPACCALLIGNRREAAYPQKGINIGSLAISPAYLLHVLLNKAGVRH